MQHRDTKLIAFHLNTTLCETAKQNCVAYLRNTQRLISRLFFAVLAKL